MTKSKHQRIAAYALIHRAGDILLCRLTSETGWAGYWGLPGGGIEFGESPEEAMRHEVKEETGLWVKEYTLEAIDNHYDERNGSWFHAIRIIYRVTGFEGSLANEVYGTTDMCAWQPLHSLGGLDLVDLAEAGVGIARNIWPSGAASSPQQIWDGRYRRYDIENKILPNHWLQAWSHLLQEGRALDIGCGLGRDTAFLLANGLDVVAIDLSEEALKKSASANPRALHLQRDISMGLGFGPNQFSIVIAGLSLHYFDRATTLGIFEEIADIVCADGIFAFSVNAVGDKNFGSPESLDGWELTDVKGIPKQFFTESKILETVGNRFEVISLEKRELERYRASKVLYECIVRKKRKL